MYKSTIFINLILFIKNLFYILSQSSGFSATSSQGWTTVSSRRTVGSKFKRIENNNRDNKRLKYTILGRLKDTIKVVKAAS